MPIEFRVLAVRDPQTLLRLLDLFAQRGLVPCRVEGRLDGEAIRLNVEQDFVGDDVAHLIAAKMRAAVLVEDVALFRDGIAVCREHTVQVPDYLEGAP